MSNTNTDKRHGRWMLLFLAIACLVDLFFLWVGLSQYPIKTMDQICKWIFYPLGGMAAILMALGVWIHFPEHFSKL